MHVLRPHRNAVRGGLRLGVGAQVDDRADAEVLQNGEVCVIYLQGIGPVEHTGRRVESPAA